MEIIENNNNVRQKFKVEVVEVEINAESLVLVKLGFIPKKKRVEVSRWQKSRLQKP